MSVSPDPQIDIGLIEQARKQINRLAEEVAQLSEQELAPPDYYSEFLQRVLTAIAAPGGAVWLRTPQGNLQLQYQINLREVGLDKNEEGRQSHDELLRQAILKGQPGFFPPQSSLGPGEEGKVAPGNPTPFVILLAPILVEKQVAGLIEIWQDPNRGPEAQRGFLRFLVRMAGFASAYTRNQQLRQMSGQQQVWTQLESFTRQIHASLNPTEVAYLVANEGRRLVECDRVSVAVRRGKRVAVEAISGADVVEKRSNLVQLQRTLFDRVVKWGEKLVYQGAPDDTLPPDVRKALDEYLAESNSKLLVVLPLRDEREKESPKPARSALMMESFEPAAAPEQMVARLEVIGKHSVSALYNAAEHRRIPMRFVWAPLAKVQEGLGGKARAILTLIGVGLAVLVGVLVFVPGTLRVDAKGELVPKVRGYVYSPAPGRVVEFLPNVRPNSRVTKGQNLVKMFDDTLGTKINGLLADVNAANEKLVQATALLERAKAPGANAQDLAAALTQKTEAQTTRDSKLAELRMFQVTHNADLAHPGEYWLKSPLTGIVLNSDFRENLTNRNVKPNEPLLRVGQTGAKVADWEFEMKIPQKNIGQVLAAFPPDDPNAELDVDLLLLSAPTKVFRGKLARNKVSPMANVARDDNNEAEPVVLCWVRISGEDIPEAERLPYKQLLTGVEVHAKVRCGKHALGYTLFYGVWEWVYEKIVFFF